MGDELFTEITAFRWLTESLTKAGSPTDFLFAPQEITIMQGMLNATALIFPGQGNEKV